MDIFVHKMYLLVVWFNDLNLRVILFPFESALLSLRLNTLLFMEVSFPPEVWELCYLWSRTSFHHSRNVDN